MKYYIGIDGGGTKTSVTIGKEDGISLATIEKTGCSHKSIGIDAVVELILDSVKEITKAVNVSIEDCAGCLIGLPCYGEDVPADKEITERLQKALAPAGVYLVNDAVVGWAGSLECNEGVHVVAGTGAIAYGRTDDNKEARSNGWSEFFSDEGSCYWVGKQAMSLFAKESDGRKPKGALYDIVKKELNLKDDMDFIDVVEKEYMPHRHMVASFQLFAKEAALAGDAEALKIYREAAENLADSAFSIIKQLGWENRNVPVSYFGGLFKSGDLILNPFKECLSKMNCTLNPPKRTATEGALLLCIKIYK